MSVSRRKVLSYRLVLCIDLRYTGQTGPEFFEEVVRLYGDNFTTSKNLAPDSTKNSFDETRLWIRHDTEIARRVRLSSGPQPQAAELSETVSRPPCPSDLQNEKVSNQAGHCRSMIE
jgi:hypothetical protein